jgi:uncharacterized protein with PQ loop repeat
MSDPKAIVTGIVCPLLGVLICVGMALAPVPALLEARRNKSLGDLSPIPFAMMCNSQLGWTLYGVMKRDYYIFFSSSIPLLLSFILTLTAIHILERGDYTEKEERLRITIERIMVGAAGLWLTIGFITGIPMGTPELKETTVTIVGSFSIISSFVFYAAPMANMREIIRTKDSSVLYWPALLMNLFNCLLWFFYGLLGVYSVMVWFPNIVSAAITATELAMCVIYPAKHRDLSYAEKGVEPPNTDFAVYCTSRRMSMDFSEFRQSQRRNTRTSSAAPSMALARQTSHQSSVDSMIGLSISPSYSSGVFHNSSSAVGLSLTSSNSAVEFNDADAFFGAGTVNPIIIPFTQNESQGQGRPTLTSVPEDGHHFEV